jgi:hypothetical protein
MSRSKRDQTFRKLDVVRAWNAAEMAGVPNPRITIDRHGTITIIPGGDAPGNDNADTPETIIEQL